MKFFAVLLLAVFATTCVRANSEECTEDRAEACIDILLSSILGDTSEEEVCRELRTSIDCLREAVDDCLVERDDDVEDGLQELENILRENCNADDDNDNDNDEEETEDFEKCYQENEDYVMECIYEGTQQALTLLMDKEDVDEDTMKCAMYGMMASCFVDRVREKCGDKAGDLAEEELSELPQEIEDACNAAGGIETHVFNLLDDKKRK